MAAIVGHLVAKQPKTFPENRLPKHHRVANLESELVETSVVLTRKHLGICGRLQPHC